MPFYLAFKELWRARGRYILFSLVIALITLLVLFVAALAEGLGSGNREYIEKLNADLLVYQANVDLNVGASRIGAARLNEVRRVPGVKAVGPIATSNGSVMLEGGRKPLGVALIGVEPGQPGEPPVVTGEGLRGRRAKEAVIDRQVALRTGLNAGDTVTIKTIQDTKEQYYTLRVAGVTDNRQYSLQPTIILPIRTWDEIRPQAVVGGVPDAEIVANVVAVRAGDPSPEGVLALARGIEGQVQDVVAVDRVMAYEATPGYSAQQSTLNTQKYFALIIGASNTTVGLAAVVQIIAVTVIGVGIGTAATLLLSLGFPPTIPIVFSPAALAASIASLLLIRPMGGLVSVGYSLRVEPLTALGLSG